MARTRNVRADDFLDEVLGAEDFPIEGHMLRVGLNCLADREGLLEDRPKRIAAQIFPYRPGIDVDALLVQLHRVGSIRRYVVGNQRLIQLIGFVEQQKPHPNEAKSQLPAPPEIQDGGSVTPAPVMSGCIPRTSEPIPNPPDASPPMSPDPGSLIPDPLSDPGEPGDDGEEAADGGGVDATGPRPEALRDLWNRMADKHGVQRWAALSNRRKASARTALKACGDLDRWERFLDHTLAQPFFQGKNERGWRADVDWLLRAKTADQVLDFDGQLPLEPVAQVVPINQRRAAAGGDVPNVPSFRPPGEG